MSVISLLSEQLKNNLNVTTKDLIISLSKQFNLPHKDLLNIWNNLNPDFKYNFNYIAEHKEQVYRPTVIIEDEEEIIVRKPKAPVIIEDEEEIIVRKAKVDRHKVKVTIED